MQGIRCAGKLRTAASCEKEETTNYVSICYKRRISVSANHATYLRRILVLSVHVGFYIKRKRGGGAAIFALLCVKRNSTMQTAYFCENAHARPRWRCEYSKLINI